MVLSSLVLLCLASIVSYVSVCSATPSLSSLRTDLTLLVDDDLYGRTAYSQIPQLLIETSRWKHAKDRRDPPEQGH